MTAPMDLTDSVFGLWSVLGRGGNTKAGKATWVCKCACGVERSVVSSSLIKGVSVSCGCHQSAVVSSMNFKHGMTGTTEYRSWQMMMSRCYNRNFPDYDLYGGRGIVVCDSWKDFRNFYSDMGGKPEGKTSIDRVDVNGNYEPSNCRWASQIEQCNNVRKNRFVLVDGNRMTIANAARKLGKRYSAVMWAVNSGKMQEVSA